MHMDMTPSSMARAGSPGATNFSREATSSLHAHSEGCFVAAGPPCVGLFGLSMDKQLQLTQPQGWGR